MRDERRSPPRPATGRVAAVHAQIALVISLLVGQLWLLTAAWDELELEHLDAVVTLAIASGILFLLGLGVLLAHRE